MKNLFTLIFFFCSLALSAQKDPIADALVNLYSQLLVFPQEKVYVQTDRPYYLTGEKIFFRAFLLHASKLTPATFSRYVYVELVSPVGSAVIRTQICLDEDKMFYGVMTLPESLPEGEYRIRSYTRYMENMGESSFYTRSVFISDPKSSKTEAETNFDFSREGRVGVKLRFKDAKSGEVRSPAQYEFRMGNSQKGKVVKPDNEGRISEEFDLEENDSLRTLLVEFKDGSNSFRKYIQIPYEGNLPEISFYPEGGQLVAGAINRVAFKALLSGGSSARVKGSVYNSHDELQTFFSTQHEGMGLFSLKAVAGESYYARYEYNNTIADVKLPGVSTNAIALQASWEGDSLSVSVRRHGEMPQEPYYLLMHRQGVPIWFQPWDFTKQNHQWSKEKFNTGLTHLMLLTKDFKPVSERMVFINRNDEPAVEISTNAISYHPGELVKLDISLPNAADDTIASTFALAVTDDKDVKLDTTTNIIAEILLSSELKGYISNPAWYFGEGKEETEGADLLMLTHGWRRYHVPEALQGQLQKPVVKPEIMQSLSGVLKSKSGRPYKNGIVQLTAVGYKYSETIESDEQGRYKFTNFEFPDSTAYQFIALTKEKSTNIEVCPDVISYPPVTIPWPNSGNIVAQERRDESFIEYVLKANRKYVQGNGMREVDLPEITVKAAKKKKKTHLPNEVTPTMPRYWISPEEMRDYPPATFEELFYRIPGVTDVSENGISFGMGNYAKIAINGIARDYSVLYQNVHINDIAQVDVYRGTATILGGLTEPLILIITWPPGTSWGIEEGPANNIKNILPLGYQQPVEFYSPRYDTPEALSSKKADLRSTIYWKPNVKTEKDAKTSVEFYTADAPTSYSITIEGIGVGRKLIYCRKKGFIRVMESK